MVVQNQGLDVGEEERFVSNGFLLVRMRSGSMEAPSPEHHSTAAGQSGRNL
jgi:hypothetical protein